MSWHSYNTNPSTTHWQGQNQEPGEELEASGRIAPNTDNISEYVESEPLFEDLEPFTADHLLDFLSRYCPPTTSSNLGNAPPTLNFQPASGENNPNNIQSSNCSSNHMSNDSEMIPSKPPFLCPWPNCKRREEFSCKATLKRHYKTLHVTPGLWECDKCAETFNRKDNLSQHLRSGVHEDKKKS